MKHIQNLIKQHCTSFCHYTKDKTCYDTCIKKEEITPHVNNHLNNNNINNNYKINLK